jgi:hypoxanthine phosphoribosyltransferase
MTLNEPRRNLSAIANSIYSAMAHNAEVVVTLNRGGAVSGRVVSKYLVRGFKYDPRVKDRSPVIAVFEDGQEVAIEDIASVVSV